MNIKIPWVEKYRPKKINEVILNKYTKKKFTEFIKNKYIPSMIISGDTGTGKTTTILCVIKNIFEDDDDFYNHVLELNASDDRGLSIINSIIIPFCKKKTIKRKIIILDEADSVTTKAQNLLSNLISNKSNASFIFICNEGSKLTESIQSKCVMIKFPKIKNKKIYKRIKNICENENIEYDNDGLETLLLVSNYDIRQCINNLECIFYSYKKITKKNIYKFVDIPKPIYIEKILNNILQKKFKESILITKELYDIGYSPNDILLTFMKYLLDNKKLNEQIKLKIFEIVSTSYIRVNDGIQSLLQLCGCISNIYIYINNN